MRIAEYLTAYPDDNWVIAKQMGICHAVARMPDDAKEVADDPRTMRAMKERFTHHGFEIAAIEPCPICEEIKLGTTGRDAQIERYIRFIRLMGEMEIPTLVQNFMAGIGWYRSRKDICTRGDARVTGFMAKDVQNTITEHGYISQERIWENLEYFLKAVIPAAEEAGVRIALHPDDPPVPALMGIGRILISREAIVRALSIVNSPNLGITFCQGCFATMGEDVYDSIAYFARMKKLFFVHFRDVEGCAEQFEERFHDDGMTDMARAVAAYLHAGYEGFARVDHVPTMLGEKNDNPGYESAGRLFAVGYLKGLLEATRRHVAG